MTLNTTDRFISASAAGTDWRDTARAVLEEIEGARTEQDGFNVGFIYISDLLASQAPNILDLFKSVTKIDHWTGCLGIGVCGVGEAYVDEPAISVLVGKFHEEQFRIFSTVDSNLEPAARTLNPWLENQDAMLTVVHGDGAADLDVPSILMGLDNLIGGFLVGGISSSREGSVQFADNCVAGGLSGIAFSSDVETVTALTQGCTPLGKVHTITRCDRNIVMELDGQRAFDVFATDLKNFATEKAEENPLPAIEEEMLARGQDAHNKTSLFKGEINAAFPVSGTDVRDYIVRGVLGIDSDKGFVSVGMAVNNGDHIMFVQRDDSTVCSELARTLLDLRARVQKEQGVFQPKGALYISCVARAGDAQGSEAKREMSLVREIIGDVPLAGFYAYGEISNKRLYGYTGILILFL